MKWREVRMRTARIMAATDSVFRNTRQYLQSNEQVFRMMQEGELSQFAGGQGNRRRKKRQDRRNSSRKVALKTNSKSITILGLRYDAISIAHLQNHLLKHAEKISMARKQATRIRAYRSSV